MIYARFTALSRAIVAVERYFGQQKYPKSERRVGGSVKPCYGLLMAKGSNILMRCNIHSWRLQVSPRSINYWIGFYHFIHYSPRRRYIALSMFFSSCVGLRLPRAAGYAAMVLAHVTWQPTAYFPTLCSSGYYPPFQHRSSASVSSTYHPILWPTRYLPNPLPPSKSFIRNNTIEESPGYVWAPNTVLLRGIAPWKGLQLCGLPCLGYLYVLNI